MFKKWICHDITDPVKTDVWQVWKGGLTKLPYVNTVDTVLAKSIVKLHYDNMT